MTEERKKSLGKYISLILRHKPETIGITLDEHGWASVKELLDGISRTRSITFEELDEIVRTNDKRRYSFNDDKTKIRANQGHSVNVDVELKELSPPDFLYHGTASKSVASIFKQGLLPGSRLYVHLSPDKETALKVGARHGKPVVFLVDSRRMSADGIPFFKSENDFPLFKITHML